MTWIINATGPHGPGRHRHRIRRSTGSDPQICMVDGRAAAREWRGTERSRPAAVDMLKTNVAAAREWRGTERSG